MNKRNLYIFSAVTTLLIVLIGGYFFLSRLGILPKRQVVYTQPNLTLDSLRESQPDVSVEGIQQEENNQPSAISNQEEKAEVAEIDPGITDPKNVDVKKTQPSPAPVEKKTVEPEKQAETKGEAGKIVDKLISWGFTKSTDRKIDTIIVHSSYDALGDDPYSVSGIIAEYKQYGVSAHYLIARDGVIYRLVADQNIAWHAGVSKMPDGRTNVNDFSIGVEMINTQDGKYTDEQYSALNSLIASLKDKYGIKNILGHNEIAPGRKTDPWGIDWKKVNR